MSKQLLILPCMQCIKQSISTGKTPLFPLYRCFTEPTNVITFTCPNGHINRVAPQTPPFDLLLRWAFEDFTDGNYAAAMANFASSLERFIEFSYKVIQKANGLSIDEINDFWQPLSKNSERQLGAFIGLYNSILHKSPFNINKYGKMANYRNSALHAGIRNRNETEKYGQYVIEIIHNTIEDLITHGLANAKNEMAIDQLTQIGPHTSTVANEFVSWEYTSDEIKKIEKDLLTLSCRDPQKYAEMANKATEQQKALSINEKQELILISQEQYEQINKNKKYRGRKTFEQYCEKTRQEKQMFSCQEVIAVATDNS